MKKAAAAAAVLGAIAAGIALVTYAGPRGEPAASARDYPLEVGLRWTYRGAGNVAVVRRIERAVEIDGRRYFEMTFVLPILGRRAIPMRHAPEGVVTVQEGRERLLVRLPLKTGDRWTVDLPSEKEVAECAVLGEEEIEFAGRKGAAMKVEVRRRKRDAEPVAIDHEWYAPGVGLVRMEVTHGIRATFVLESFERSK